MANQVSPVTNRGFARGLVSPYLFARPEIEDFPYSARHMDNFIITKEAATQTRPFTVHVDECRSPSTEKRLIKFIYSASSGDTYIVEAGHEYMEFVRAGARITETSLTITGATQANPCVITTSTAHGLTAGDHVKISSIVGMVELNGGRYIVETPSTTTLSLKDVHGNAVNSTNYTAYSSGGSVARVYKIASPYQESDLQELKFSQSADVMYITHPSYTTRKLSRTSHTSWTLAEASYGPSVSGPTALSVTAGGSGGGLTYEYTVTSVAASGEESLAGVEAAKTITAITLNNPIRITAATHGYTSGQEVLLSGISGTTELNDRRFVISVADANNFDLVGIDGTSGYTAYTSGGSSFRTSDVITNANEPTTAAPHVITWTAVSGITRYAVYRKLYGVWGFIGYSSSTTFSDPNITPDTSQGVPEYQEEFRGTGNYAGAVTLHQQRVVYGGSDNEPDTVKASQTGAYDNFSTHTPLGDADPVEFTLASTEVNRIIHLVSLRRLIALTGSSEWAIEGNSSGTLIPSAINARPYTGHGASHVRPVVIDNDILYVQARGNVIRSLFYDFDRDSYTSQDVTLKASHLFRGYSVRDMDFAKIPDSLLWVVRSDGKLLGLTYCPEVSLLAWHPHTLGGTFSSGDPVVEQVSSVPENDSAVTGGENAVYLIVKRTVNGQTVRYIERMKERVINQDVRDRYTWWGPDWQMEAPMVDSIVTYNGLNTGSATMTLTSGGGWTEADTLTLTASSSTFLSSDVGTDATSRKFFLWDSSGNVVRCTVTGYTGATIVSVRPDRPVPTALRAASTTRWASAVRKVSGLRHLEGQSVSALGDGFVAANAYTDSTAVTVSSGAATFEDFYAVLHVGLPFKADLEPHDIEFPQGTLYGRRKKVVGVGLYLKDSLAFWAGEALPDEEASNYTGPTQGLYRSAERDLDDEDADDPIPLLTEFVQVNLPGGRWTDHGRAVIRHLDPRPLTLLSLIRMVEVASE